jgi:ACR3 family arsenite transporter
MDKPYKTKVLFLGTHNSCRSQMAEGLMKQLYGESVIVSSAGSCPGNCVNESAILVLRENNIDITQNFPKSTQEVFIDEDTIDYVITLCSNEGDGCPRIAGRKVLNYIHQLFDDPSALPAVGDDGLDNFRRVREEIKSFLLTLPIPMKQEEGKEEGNEDNISDPFSVDNSLLPIEPSPIKENEGISFFERYLTIWVLLCMIIGTLIGYFQPSIVQNLKQAEIYTISIPIAILLWIMIFPMLLQIDFQVIYQAISNPGPIFLTTFINFAIQPFTMYIIALLFFRYFYSNIISEELANEYLIGCILLGGAPCTAMVFVWSVLVNGDPGYTIVQVAANDGVMLLLYLPTMMLLLNASSIPIPYKTIAISVCFFLAIPLLLAIFVRKVILTYRNEDTLKKTINFLKPVCPIGLLSTLILIFIYQGETIGNKPIHILLIIIPLSIQTFIIFGLSFWLGYSVCMDFNVLAPASLISTSNFFELAVAIAISIYGPDSGASLATVVGVLVEVPTMLFLVYICKKIRPIVEKRCEECDEKCSRLRDFARCKKKNVNSFTPIKTIEMTAVVDSVV